MDIREASKITILEETDLGCTILKTEQGHTIVVTDECNEVYIPDEITKKYKTRFFRIHVNQGGIILIPARMKLELVEEEERILGGSIEEYPKLTENSEKKEGEGSFAQLQK